MINRVANLTQIETLSGNISAATYFDANIQPAFSAINDSSLGQVNGICTDTGSANVYQIIAANMPYGPPSALNPGFTVFFTPANTNTGASNLTVGSLASAPILNAAGLALSGGEISKSQTLGVVYGNVAPAGFRIIGPCGFTRTGTVSGNQTYNVAGYTSVSVQLTFSAGTNVITTFNNVSFGVPISIALNNNTGAAQGFFIKMTNAAGGTINVNGVQSSSGGSGYVSLNSTGIALANSSAMNFTGVVCPFTVLLH